MTALTPPYTSNVDLVSHGALGLFAAHMKETYEPSIGVLKNEFISPSPSPNLIHSNNFNREITASPNPFAKSNESLAIKSVPFKPKRVSMFDILLAMMDRLAGKDKMAKAGQYSLRLVLFYSKRTRDYLSSSDLNLKIINAEYSGDKKILLLNFLKHPNKFIKIIILLFTSILDDKLNGVVKGLSMYRQFLRFGKTPFRITKLARKLYDTTTVANKGINFNIDYFHKQWINQDSFGDIAGLYYGICDETLLLYKLGFLSNMRLRKFAGKHESYSWYYDILLGIYKNFNKLNELKQKEFEVKIEKRIKNKAKFYSRQMLESKSNENSSPLKSKLNFNQLNNKKELDENDLNELKEVKELKYQQYLTKLDLSRLLFDFTFDSFDVWNLKLPFENCQILIGICSASLAVTKIYNDTRTDLMKK